MLPFSPPSRTIPERADAKQNPESTLYHLLAYAAFAPSVHNTQPWRVWVQSPTQCTIFLEKNIHLPKADPTGRGGFLAIGAFVENFFLAAAANGYHLETSITHDSEPRSTTVQTLFTEDTQTTPANERSRIVHAICTRATSRGLFHPIPHVERVIKKLTTAPSDKTTEVHFLADETRIKKLAELIREGTALAYGDRAFCAEHAEWLRPNWTFHRDGIPGYAIGIPTALSFLVPYAIRYKDMRVERADQEYAKALSTNLFVGIASTNDTPSGWISAGRRLQRLLIDITCMGLIQSPNAAAVEMGSLGKEVGCLMGTNALPQLMVRIGTGSAPRLLTPRHPVASFLRPVVS